MPTEMCEKFLFSSYYARNRIKSAKQNYHIVYINQENIKLTLVINNSINPRTMTKFLKKDQVIIIGMKLMQKML